MKKKELLEGFKDLVAKKRKKPFECVGTKKESQKALDLSFKKYKKEQKITLVLGYFKKEVKNE